MWGSSADNPSRIKSLKPSETPGHRQPKTLESGLSVYLLAPFLGIYWAQSVFSVSPKSCPQGLNWPFLHKECG